MPVTNNYSAIAGSIPSPHSLDFPKWVNTYISLRKKYCMFQRTTKYYIDPVSGDDSKNKTQATSPTNPWKTLTNVRHALAGDSVSIGGTTGFTTPVTNAAFLFKRGTTTYDNGGLIVGSVAQNSVVNNNGLYFGSYGAYSSAGKAKISNFTMSTGSGSDQGVTYLNIASGSWTASGSNGMFYTTISSLPTGFSTVGWVRMKAFPYIALTYCDSSAKLDALAGNGGIGFYATGTTLYVALGLVANGSDPGATGIELEFTPGLAGSDNGINIGSAGFAMGTQYSTNTYFRAPCGIVAAAGSDKIWINDLIFEGFGCQSQVTDSNHSGILSANNMEEVSYVSNCESYYNGRHAISQESSDNTSGATGTIGIGGTHLVENCIAGYCTPIGGSSTFNSYSNSGLQECSFIGCVEKYGCLPASVNTTAGQKYPAAGHICPFGSFYGHSGGTIVPNPASGTPAWSVYSGKTYATGLYLNINCRIHDSRGDIETLGLTTVGGEGWGFANQSGSYSTTPGTQQFLTGTENDPTTYRVFIIGWKSPRYRIIVPPDLRTDSTGATTTLTMSSIANVAYSRTCFINCNFYRRMTTGSDVSVFVGSSGLNGISGLWMNCVFEIDSELSSNNIYLMSNTSAAPTVQPRFLNCLFSIRGGLFDSGANNYKGYFAIGTNYSGSYSNTWSYGNNSNTPSTGIRMGNCALISWDRALEGGSLTPKVNNGIGTPITFSQGYGGLFSDGATLAYNDPLLLRYIATAGAISVSSGTQTGGSGSNTSPVMNGFNKATGYINLLTNNTGYPVLNYGVESSLTLGLLGIIPGSNFDSFNPNQALALDSTSPLVSAGNANPFGDILSSAGMIPAPQYSWGFLPRPATPAIGPFDLLNNTLPGTNSNAGLSTLTNGIVSNIIF